MATVAALRAGLVARLATIPGLRVPSQIPDQPNPPVALVAPESIDYHASMGSSAGPARFEFRVLVLVGRVSERSAQTDLDAYCSPTGTKSIKAAVDADRTLGGAAPATARVTRMRSYQQIPVGELVFLGAEFIVEILA